MTANALNDIKSTKIPSPPPSFPQPTATKRRGPIVFNDESEDEKVPEKIPQFTVPTKNQTSESGEHEQEQQGVSERPSTSGRRDVLGKTLFRSLKRFY